LIVESKAYAKVNLHLEVLNRRHDGYHNIFSLMASVGVFDLLQLRNITLSRAGTAISVDVIPAGGAFGELMHEIPPEDNLIRKAAVAYLNGINRSADVVISVEKNIPAGAGLGGGSSDAAAVLRLLNGYFKEKSEKELLNIAATIGADVPFCLTGGFAFCEGIGDRIEGFNAGLNHWVVIACSDVRVDTAEAYRSLNRSRRRRERDSLLEEKRERMRAGVQSGDLRSLRSLMRNDFEEMICSRYPAIRKARELILACNPDFAVMTGSGSGVVGLFHERTLAEQAERRLREESHTVFFTKFL